jgi:hypothetical protein
VRATETSTVIPLASEPHHQLSLHNDYVNVYKVQVSPNDSVLLHRHDFDAISVMLSDNKVTVITPGKPEVHRTLTATQIRLQARGLIHSTHIDGDNIYRNLTVELLLPQNREHNACTEVIPDKPLNCPVTKVPPSGVSTNLVQFESDQTSVSLTRIPPHQSVALGHPTYPKLVIALGTDLSTEASQGNLRRPFDSGKFLWIESGKTFLLVSNNGDTESELAVFTFRSP